MLLDHIGIVFFPDVLILRIIGRLSFPLFAWSIARGYIYTNNFKKYAARLLFIAFISQFPFHLIFNNNKLNICFTLFAGLIIIYIYNSYNSHFKWTGIIIILLLSHCLNFEYGIYGTLSILLFYVFWNDYKFIYYYGLLTLVCTLVFRYDPIQLFSVLSCIPILFIGEDDKNYFKFNNFFKYSFYPGHMLLLYFFNILITKK